MQRTTEVKKQGSLPHYRAHAEYQKIAQLVDQQQADLPGLHLQLRDAASQEAAAKKLMDRTELMVLIKKAAVPELTAARKAFDQARAKTAELSLQIEEVENKTAAHVATKIELGAEAKWAAQAGALEIVQAHSAEYVAALRQLAAAAAKLEGDGKQLEEIFRAVAIDERHPVPASGGLRNERPLCYDKFLSTSKSVHGQPFIEYLIAENAKAVMCLKKARMLRKG